MGVDDRVQAGALVTAANDEAQREHLRELLYDTEWVRRDHAEAARLRALLHSPAQFKAWVSGRLKAPSDGKGLYEIEGGS